jgi:hypothetical protein
MGPPAVGGFVCREERGAGEWGAGNAPPFNQLSSSVAAMPDQSILSISRKISHVATAA